MYDYDCVYNASKAEPTSANPLHAGKFRPVQTSPDQSGLNHMKRSIKQCTAVYRMSDRKM